MAKKKLLNEATVRRFMGLAGMESSLVSNKLNEMGGMGKSYKKHYGDKNMEEGSYNMEEDQMEEGSYNMEEDLYEEEEDDMGDDADLNLDQDKAREIVDAYDTLGELVNDIKASMDDMGGEEDEEDDMGDMGDEDEDAGMDLDKDEEGDEAEMLGEIELQLSEDEIVQEVAKRVAKRILRAKRAKAQLDEALGRTKRRR